MGTVKEAFASCYRDFNLDGVEASGRREPPKADLRQLGATVEAAIASAGLGALIDVVQATRTALNADLAHDAGTIAMVYADGTETNNDLYVKSGASGTGGWTLTTIVHDMMDGKVDPFVTAAEAAAEAAAASEAAAAGSASAGAGYAAAAALSSLLASQAEAGALAAGNLYPDTIAGLAATAANGYFWVVGPDDITIAILYRKEAGVAVEKKRQTIPDSVLLYGAVPADPDDLESAPDSTAAFVALEAVYSDEMIDLGGAIFAVNPVPHGNQYYNGRFHFLGEDAEEIDDAADDPWANVFFGYRAGRANLYNPGAYPSENAGDVNYAGGNRNTAFGWMALSQNVDGRRNTAVGAFSMRLTTGHYNTALGGNTLFNNTSGKQNTAIGEQALQANQTADNNTAVGHGALIANTTGPRNTAVGMFALANNVSAGGLVAVGYRALLNNTTAEGNVAVGEDSLALVTTNGRNTAVGAAALGSSTALGNTALGFHAAYLTTTGEFNVAVGDEALVLNTTGNYNVAIGKTALGSAVSASNCVAIGRRTLSNATGGSNTVVGADAGIFTTTGGDNAALGYSSLADNTTGSQNTALGVGAMSGSSTYSNSSALGYQAAVTGSNQVQLGNASTTAYAYGSVQNRSDARDKADVRDTVLGLDFINALRAVDFRWDRRDEYRTAPPARPDIERPAPPDIERPAPPREDSETFEADMRDHELLCAEYERRCAEYERLRAEFEQVMEPYRVEVAAWVEANKLGNINKDGSKKRARYHHGVIAQELQAVLKAQGIDFGGFQDHSLAGGDDVLSVGYSEFIGPLIKAVQELSAKVKRLEDAALDRR